MSDRFVVLGLGSARAPWFAAVGQWAHAGSIPADFVRCVSVEQLRARLGSDRRHSAVIFDGASPGVDRDVLEVAREAGVAAFVVDATARREYWADLGVDTMLPDGFGPADLTEALRAHAATVPSGEWHAQHSPDEEDAGNAGYLFALCGPGGTGASTLAIALAQQWATDRRHSAGDVALADFCLRGEQGVLHDAGDIGPGVQELVDQCRTVSLAVDQTRAHTYAVVERGYALLLGLRRPAAWSTLRPRAIAVALGGLRYAFGSVVCDCDADLEGQGQGGSLDVEERNGLARAAVTHADATFAVGLPGLKGVYSLARVLGELVDVGVAPGRIVPVFNRAPRGPRARAVLTRALAAMLPPPVGRAMASPIFVPERDVEQCLHDRRRLPAALGDPLVDAIHAALARPADAPSATEAPHRIERGHLRALPEEVVTS